jgi:O-antigen ligase
VGLGAYRVAITRHHEASGEWIPPAAHNEYLEIAAGGGLIAVILITWFAAGVIRAAWSKLKLPSAFQRSTSAGALVGLFGVTVHNLVDFGLRSPVNALLFGCLIAIAIVDADFETA